MWPTFLALLIAQEGAVTSTATDTATSSEPAPTVDEQLMEINSKVDSLQEASATNSVILEQLARIKLSAYVQGRYEYHADSVNGLNASGRPATTSQFLVRRGRLKVAYNGIFAEMMLQIDATPRGFTLKDAEATFIEPWSGYEMRLTAGQFKWPFGYEVVQSSNVREMPERARVIRALFPGERDRGVRFQAAPGVLRFAVALVNGNGTEDSIYTANDQNRMKDVVGRLGVDLDWITAGVSGYLGENLATMVGPPPAITSFRKSRIGADVQVYLDTPALGGLALKGEVIRGEELEARPFGFWVLAAQNIGDDFALFTRFDHYDRDTNKSDDAVSTIGGGAHYFFSGNLKASLTYEHPISETAEGAAEPDDDTLTFQLQGMFGVF